MQHPQQRTQAVGKRPARKIARLILQRFSSVPDPRVERMCTHPMINIVFIAFSAILCGANGWEDMELFAQSRRTWLESYLDLSSGIPCADTFRRFFEAVNPTELEKRLMAWVRSVYKVVRGQVISCDGKSTKGAVNPGVTTQPLHTLHVWSNTQHLLLGCKKVKGSPGELHALLELLPTLEVRGAILTADANYCASSMTRAVRAAKAHYVLQLKGNRGPQLRAVVSLFQKLRDGSRPPSGTYFRVRERSHGRVETRSLWVKEIESWPKPKRGPWADVRTAVMVKRERKLPDRTEVQWHYYVTDLPPEPKALAEFIRTHWGIENKLHWVLDVTFREDARRVRDQTAAENLNVLNRFALMLLERAPTHGKSMAQRRKEAAWTPCFLEVVLSAEI